MVIVRNHPMTVAPDIHNRGMQASSLLTTTCHPICTSYICNPVAVSNQSSEKHCMWSLDVDCCALVVKNYLLPDMHLWLQILHI